MTRTVFNYRKRWLAEEVNASRDAMPVTVITGARQVGKSTLLRHEWPSEKYVSLDDYEALDMARRAPMDLLASGVTIIDEVQKAPELLPAIKLSVDNDRTHGFMLSGSANLLLMAKVTESLSGRALFLKLWPMTVGEMKSHSPGAWLADALTGRSDVFDRVKAVEIPHLEKLVWRGGMPGVMDESIEMTTRWRDGYIETYLERDLRQLSQIENLPDFNRLMRALACRSGQLLNLSAVSRELGIKQPTASRYVNLLETGMLVSRLPAYTVNRGLRLVKSPKIMWADSGLACHLSGRYSPDELVNSREWGNLLESFVWQQLRAMADCISPRVGFSYWRTRNGNEVDFVLEQGHHLLAIEVKGSANVRYGDTQGLAIFLKTYPEAGYGILLYNGQEIKRMAERIYAIPVSALWQ